MPQELVAIPRDVCIIDVVQLRLDRGRSTRIERLLHTWSAVLKKGCLELWDDEVFASREVPTCPYMWVTSSLYIQDECYAIANWVWLVMWNDTQILRSMRSSWTYQQWLGWLMIMRSPFSWKWVNVNSCTLIHHKNATKVLVVTPCDVCMIDDWI